MKIHLKFDHSQKKYLKAIGCEYDGEQVNERVMNIIEEYLHDDSLDGKSSELSELIHDKLEYEEILFLATHSVQKTMMSIMMEQIKNEMKDFLNQ